MGSSQPTISQQIDAYRAAHATFRAWLPVQGQARIDRLVEALYRAGPALNMTEDLDFYRRALLVGLLDLGADFDRRMAAVELATGLRKPMGLERFVGESATTARHGQSPLEPSSVSKEMQNPVTVSPFTDPCPNPKSLSIQFGVMDLRQRWIIARQDHRTEWEFFADCGIWTEDFHAAVLFHTLWGAEEARAHSAGGHGDVRNAAEVAEFMLSHGPASGQAEAAA